MKTRALLAMLAAGLAAGSLSSCTTYGPQSLPVGTSLQATSQAMGAPTAETALQDGGRRVEYARGPFGKHTYLLEFDAQGQLRSWEQVLTETRFNAIRSEMSSAEVLAQIGHPSETFVVGWKVKQNVWAYRYESPFCQWFQVGLDPQSGKVVDTAYGPDPICERRERNSLF